MGRAVAVVVVCCGWACAHHGAFLRVVDATHVGVVSRIDTDSAHRMAVTCSVDKTAKIWDLGTGRLLQTLYPPAAPGQEGRLYACALSPDGSVIALGGWTGWNRDGACSVYIYDTKSGRLVRRIEGFPNAIADLEFSPDGTRLAACMLSGGGVALIDARSWTILASARVNGSCADCAFDPVSRLAVAADGAVWLYSASLECLDSVIFSQDRSPCSVSFDRHRRVLAVGHHASRRVSLYDARTMHPAGAIDLGGGRDPAWVGVCWSGGGELHAWAVEGNPAGQSWTSEMFSWKPGTVQPKALARVDEAVIMCRVSRRNEVLFVCRDPVWGVVRGHGKVVLHQPALLDLSQQSRLIAGEHGMTVGFQAPGKPWCTFSVRDQNLRVHRDTVPAANDAVDRSRTEAARILGAAVISRRISLPERPRCAARAETGVVVGTNWNLHCIDSRGYSRWRIPVSGPVGSIASPGGDVCVVALGDGTIRWHRITDGVELLALVVDSALVRWAAWDGKGNWNGSRGGEKLLGWFVGRGPDTSGSLIALRPGSASAGVVSRALDNAGGRSTVRGTYVTRRQDLPPSLVIDQPGNGAIARNSPAEILVQTSTPRCSPLSDLTLRISGPLGRDGKQGLLPQNVVQVTFGFQGRLSEGENRVSVWARNSNGCSDTATVTVPYEDPHALPRGMRYERE